jgi:hypothetical protein
MKQDTINIDKFETTLKTSPGWSIELQKKWDALSRDQQLEYIVWVYTDRKQTFGTFLENPGRGAGWDVESINFFEKYANDSLKRLMPRDRGGSSRRRRSIPKSSRKYKKSAKRVFRKKSRSTRRR